jgi:hypothetical protein
MESMVTVIHEQVIWTRAYPGGAKGKGELIGRLELKTPIEKIKVAVLLEWSYGPRYSR